MNLRYFIREALEEALIVKKEAETEQSADIVEELVDELIEPNIPGDELDLSAQAFGLNKRFDPRKAAKQP